MRNITRASIALIGAVALTGATAMSASAATDSTGTTTTAVVEGGGISIVVSDTLALASSSTLTAENDAVVASGDVLVTVTDDTAGTLPWTASMSVTDFVSGVEGATDIPATAFTYTAPQADVTGAAGQTVTPGGVVTPIAPEAALAVQTAAGVVGNNVASWTADVSLAIPASTIAGTYEGTMTHSVLN